MIKFKEKLYKKVKQSQFNNFGIENFDEYRFGPYPYLDQKKKWTLKKTVKKIICYNPYFNSELVDNFINEYLQDIEQILNNISKKDQELYLSLIAYRILGYRKIKLSRNNKEYWEAIETAKSLSNSEDTIDPHFMHFVLKKIDLKPIGFDASFYFSEKGIATDFILEQYAYKINGKSIVSAKSGDTVLDIGGCWGDTALYFANKVGENGKVYSFEFIPNNLKLFNTNISLNPALSSKIELIPNPVSNTSGELIYFKDNGPGSKVEFQSFEGQTGTSPTISVDDFVKLNGITRVDFIKMDIEGAEPLALEGAVETIKKFRPKLAIAIYHSMNDFVSIPNWILNLDLGYEIFIGHYTIHAEETICFAKPINKF